MIRPIYGPRGDHGKGTFIPFSQGINFTPSNASEYLGLATLTISTGSAYNVVFIAPRDGLIESFNLTINPATDTTQQINFTAEIMQSDDGLTSLTPLLSINDSIPNGTTSSSYLNFESGKVNIKVSSGTPLGVRVTLNTSVNITLNIFGNFSFY